jgi:hypothetical protein
MDMIKSENNNLNVADPNIAEHSRPKRHVIEEQRQANTQPRGRNRVNEHESAKLTFWQTPLLWPHFVKAVSAVGWNPGDIAAWLKKTQPVLFARIARRTVDRWIEEDEHGRPRWTQNCLERVRRGKPLPNVTRVGVLVSCFWFCYSSLLFSQSSLDPISGSCSPDRWRITEAPQSWCAAEYLQRPWADVRSHRAPCS